MNQPAPVSILAGAQLETSAYLALLSTARQLVLSAGSSSGE